MLVGFRNSQLSGHAPPLALLARRGCFSVVRSRDERAAEVRAVACAAGLCARLTGHTVRLQASAGAPVTVWVKRTDFAGAQYVEVENLRLDQTVSKLKARWLAQAKLEVDPALVTLLLLKCGARKPAPEDEAAAVVLDDPRLTLAAAGVSDGCSLLADSVQHVQRKGKAKRLRAERRAPRGAHHVSCSRPFELAHPNIFPSSYTPNDRLEGPERILSGGTRR